MKRSFTLLALFIGLTHANATIHEVEVGGVFGQSVPYYAPQNVTISLGDTVRWTWASGTHNVTSTSGPFSFASGDLTAPNSFMVDFIQAGVFDYECTLFDHADTQFGTITVQDPNGIPTNTINNAEVHPTLATDRVSLSVPANQLPATVTVIDGVTGQLIENTSVTEEQHELSLQHMAAGVYVIRLTGIKGEQHTTKIVKQ